MKRRGRTKTSDFKRIFEISFKVIHFKEKIHLTWKKNLLITFPGDLASVELVAFAVYDSRVFVHQWRSMSLTTGFAGAVLSRILLGHVKVHGAKWKLSA